MYYHAITWTESHLRYLRYLRCHLRHLQVLHAFQYDRSTLFAMFECPHLRMYLRPIHCHIHFVQIHTSSTSAAIYVYKTAQRRLAPPPSADWRHRPAPIGAIAQRRLAPQGGPMAPFVAVSADKSPHDVRLGTMATGLTGGFCWAACSLGKNTSCRFEIAPIPGRSQYHSST